MTAIVFIATVLWGLLHALAFIVGAMGAIALAGVVLYLVIDALCKILERM